LADKMLHKARMAALVKLHRSDGTLSLWPVWAESASRCALAAESAAGWKPHSTWTPSTGGELPFAAGASQVCLCVVSRHSDNREAGFLSAMPQVGSEPILLKKPDLELGWQILSCYMTNGKIRRGCRPKSSSASPTEPPIRSDTNIADCWIWFGSGGKMQTSISRIFQQNKPILPAFCNAAKGRFWVSIHYIKIKSPLNVPKIKS
jgi:hypothetical protein